ncbi:MAG: hypothetical protein KJ023_21510, partial [Burkholderiaceae bacterium]|nr:hypothetical protein [Burkholderiaceae bacterium]
DVRLRPLGIRAAHVQRGRADEALGLLEPRMAAFGRASPELRFLGLRVAGAARLAQGDAQRAAALLDEALAALPERPNLARQRNTALADRAQAALALGDAAAALQWLARVRPPDGAASPSLQQAERQATQGRALLALGRRAEAAAALREAETAWQALAAASPQARAVRRWREEAEQAAARR